MKRKERAKPSAINSPSKKLDTHRNLSDAHANSLSNDRGITYIADRIFDGDRFIESTSITVKDGRIVPTDPDPVQPARIRGTLCPGFIDVQVNGGGGVFLNDDPSVSGIERMCAAHKAYGTTGLLPTFITDSLELMEKAADAVAEALRRELSGILGVHFEGPHISVAKKGVHRAQYIRKIGEEEFKVFARQDLGIKLVTVAPETVGPEDIQRLVSVGCKVCIGHSNADYATAMKAIEAGATGFTHLYNAMSPFTSRAPGVVGAALLDEATWCGLIVDGYHVCDESARLALRCKKSGKIMLVTDSMALVGTDEMSCKLFEQQITRVDDRLTVEGGTLAGSNLDMASAVKNSVERLKVPLAESLRMASLYPAEFLGISDACGKLQVGYEANFVVFNDDFQITHNSLIKDCQPNK